MNNIDFTLIKKSILIFIGILCLSILLVFTVDSGINKVYQNISQAELLLFSEKEVLVQRQQSKTSYNEVKQYIPILSGFSFNRADKLRWFEQLKFHATQLNLPSMNYQIKPRILDKSFDGGEDNHVVYYTPVVFQAGLVYDEQFLLLLDRLKHSDLGLFSTEKCEMTSQRPKDGFILNATNILVSCTLNWYEMDTGLLVDDDEMLLDEAQ